jgi:hypothetical protein
VGQVCVDAGDDQVPKGGGVDAGDDQVPKGGGSATTNPAY